MHSMPSKKTVWLSGEVCEANGIYFSDTCGHSIRKEFAANDIFIRCPSCYASVRWMRFGSTVQPLVSRPDLGYPGTTFPKKMQP